MIVKELISRLEEVNANAKVVVGITKAEGAENECAPAKRVLVDVCAPDDKPAIVIVGN